MLVQEQMQAGTDEHNPQTLILVLGLTGSAVQSAARLRFWQVAIKVEHLSRVTVVVVVVFVYIWQLFNLLFKEGWSSVELKNATTLTCTGRCVSLEPLSESLHRKVADSCEMISPDASCCSVLLFWSACLLWASDTDIGCVYSVHRQTVSRHNTR